MNRNLMIQRVHEMDAQSVDPDMIADALNIAEPTAYRMLRQEPEDVHCDRCEKLLSWRTGRQLAEVDFCAPCNAALFANGAAIGRQEYPNIFGD